MEMQMPKPGAPHQQLAKLAGTWIGEEKMMPSPWEPKGATATGRVVNTVAIDKFVVIQDYEQSRDGKVTFRGHGVFTWNDAKKCNELVWTDSMGGTLQVFAGQWKGDVLEVMSEGAQGKMRCTFDVSGGGYKFLMSVSGDGKKWDTMMEGKYRKS